MTPGQREIEAYAQLVMARLAIDDRASIADHHLGHGHAEASGGLPGHRSGRFAAFGH
jgi:hypothetical protein